MYAAKAAITMERAETTGYESGGHSCGTRRDLSRHGQAECIAVLDIRQRSAGRVPFEAACGNEPIFSDVSLCGGASGTMGYACTK